ncbi:RHS repeat-associated core domain-containing protein [Tumidithrix elongata RA019]|uniref:RHS repeat-associated core domain-containing protein n=1 Tax=Tumidithrix elongata BACA0141 TaxID=2716417 RepID=A0AAW9Q021_9CYAN|nr:RHS repeat-associated core domain-containing protein [Tumidithrix elongata RA019]
MGNRTGYVTTANNRLQSDGTFTYLYDDEGNRTQRTRISTGEITSYTWDYRNRLTNVDTKTSGGVLTRSVAYKYDIFDRRIGKTVDLDGAGAGVTTTEWYVYDRDHIMLVFVGSTLKERYLYGANLDQVLAVEASSQVNWTLSDYLGTVRDLVSSAGVVQKHIKYDSFGNVTAQSAPTVKSRFGFTGREFDTETGLYYYRARYYDSAVGRFISEDPISFAGGDVNLYRYVGNSATNGTDPFGLGQGIHEGEFNRLTDICESSVNCDEILNALERVLDSIYFREGDIALSLIGGGERAERAGTHRVRVVKEKGLRQICIERANEFCPPGRKPKDKPPTPPPNPPVMCKPEDAPVLMPPPQRPRFEFKWPQIDFPSFPVFPVDPFRQPS